MNTNTIKHGFYCRMYGKDCFLESNQTKRTKKIALDFINKVQNYRNTFYNIDEKDIECVQKAMELATFEIKTIKNGNFAGLSYYTIDGEMFSYGCDPCENPMEECILV